MIVDDPDTWIHNVSTEYKDAIPDMRWQREYIAGVTDIESDYIGSFDTFLNFPLNLLSVDELVKAKLYSKTADYQSRAFGILMNIENLDFTNIDSLFVLSLALRSNSKLFNEIKAMPSFDIYLWLIGQIMENDPVLAATLWNDKLMIPQYYKDRVKLQGIILLLEPLCKSWSDIEIPSLDSDKYETIFAFAYGNAPVDIKNLCQFILPRLIPHIAESNASHLYFRRMLPYCVMENRKGRKCAFKILEEILGHHTHFPSCVSTWISMHPYCVAASNNLLVDIERKGIMTTQLKPLLRQLIRINKLLQSGKITLTQETKMELPRSLWRVEFPPPEEEVKICTNTCKLVLKTYQSKWLTVLPALIILIVSYILYVYL
ncbi:hypothetical protein TVAG_076020 [Trichomonas vaginalis G3]|uniref:Uncharacterized protein n=1 Tax=Trichomonas vaginalis (strain ATCC PRA-98 / G3) TaxID=412133 RepID=A2D9J9_TRIV3|nr:hypothetical protein TVAGG3_0293160 [Trichomonas vaginalis G3]EAY22855.1 hypothetical protein TVAG_076020 [Trichomonas vaginalis G3]KAI5527431.1 hypothetical protein TVAGG3_0293160 [Trichomonas vaginalis G3]|eukprot:XP_001583841.1 hypothetical protein [Trichomonas vaginalis G3]